MSHHADARRQQRALAGGVGGFEQLDGIEARRLGIGSQLVGQRDVHVAIQHAGELDELGGLRRADIDDGRSEELLVEVRCARGRVRVEPADDLRCLVEVAHHEAALDALRRVRDCESVADRQTAGLQDRHEVFTRGSDGDRRLVDHEGARSQSPGDVSRGPLESR